MSNPPIATATPITAAKRPRVIFFGMRCAFSAPSLEALLVHGLVPTCVVLPAPAGAPPIELLPAEPPRGMRIVPLTDPVQGIEAIARRAQIPALAVRSPRHPTVAQALGAHRPDIIAVSCFPWRLPATIRNLARLGAVNVHPSLLPRWRGPEPLLWTLLAGDRETGATVHLMDDGFDTGPIVEQERIPVPDGISGVELEEALAELGGKLLVRAIDGLAYGTRQPIPQDERAATHAPMPTEEDLAVTNQLPAQRLIDLVRGIVPLWGPLTLRVPEVGVEYAVVDVVDHRPIADGDLPAVLRGDELDVRCLDAVVTLRRAVYGRVASLTLRSAM